MGKVINAITPTNTITIEITIAVTGLFIKVSAIILSLLILESQNSKIKSQKDDSETHTILNFYFLLFT
jgi:hypothetical protein